MPIPGIIGTGMKPLSHGNGGKALLFAECMILFFITPASLFYVRHWFAWRITPVVLLIALFCAACLFFDKGFDSRKLWDVRPLRTQLKGIALVFLAPALLMGVFTYVFHRPLFFYFVSTEPWLWLVFIVLYPLFACYPQEVLFRAFFFHRYGPMFRSEAVTIVMSGVSFGLAHVFFNNPFAPIFATFGGMLFAYRYAKAGTVMAPAVEHCLWGNFIFTIGMGWFFYSGSVS
jgi:membrane protease YdiL (CAAX protease family)